MAEGGMAAWFIAEGRLHCVDDGGVSRVVESPFAQDSMRRAERSRQVGGWKNVEPDDDRGRVVPRSALWGSTSGAATAVPPRFRYVAAGGDDSIYYVLTLGDLTALFRYFPAERREARLFHGAAMRCLGLAADPAANRVVLAAGNPDGTACLEIVDGEGNRRGAITGGDSIDAAPSVSAARPGTIVYQSSGVARNAQTGHVAAIGPAAIIRLDLASARLESIVEAPDVDCLAPKEDRGGNLWYIRRPYEKSVGEAALTAGKDALLFPWRVAKGVFGFLDAFSKVYGREPLKRSGGPQLPGAQPDLGALWLHGRLIALNDVRRDSDGSVTGLVPRSWELVCRNRRGAEYVAARHVAGFDVAADGAVYSNGFEIFRLVDGDWRRIGSGSLIETICAA